MTAIFRHEFTVGSEALDENRHVNNVAYVRWMQDVAVLHSAAAGCTEATRAIGAIWVAREHRIEYLAPAFAGDRVEARTWVVNFRRVRSLRRYRFVRIGDGAVLARGETDWVLVDAANGRPRAIPGQIAALFQLVPDDQGT